MGTDRQAGATGATSSPSTASTFVAADVGSRAHRAAASAQHATSDAAAIQAIRALIHTTRAGLFATSAWLPGLDLDTRAPRAVHSQPRAGTAGVEPGGRRSRVVDRERRQVNRRRACP